MTRRSQRSTHRSRQSAAASSTVHADSTPLYSILLYNILL